MHMFVQLNFVSDALSVAYKWWTLIGINSFKRKRLVFDGWRSVWLACNSLRLDMLLDLSGGAGGQVGGPVTSSGSV